jgi:prepilin-type N-terminal cleavage/methylation domain-containing protein
MMDANCGLQNAECGLERRCKSRDVALRPSIGNPQSPIRNHRSAFTLIELLVTMVIIAIISAAILGTAASAFENARRSRTRSLVTKISGLVLERWDSYAERRVEVSRYITGRNISPLPPDSIQAKLQSGDITAAQAGQMIADSRLIALRELMKMEMPDRWQDVVNDPSILAGPPDYPVSGLVQLYRRAYAQSSSHADIEKHQGAECLYLIVMYGTGDGEARTLFSSQDIGDVDADGAPEFLDGWGNPIEWIRWPAGYTSDLQPRNPDGSRPEGDHDPFDYFRRDSPAVQTPTEAAYPSILRPHVAQIRTRNQQQFPATRLVPLIFSAGPDQESNEPGYWYLDRDVSLDPYHNLSDGTQEGLVHSDKDTWRDNITNHVNNY